MISVLMSTYNGEKYIIEQLKSILSQTVQVDEIVIIDDCSSDNTVSIIKKFILTYDLFSKCKLYVNATNRGWMYNFFNGIEKTQGDIIFFSDQDDIWFNDKVKIQSALLTENENANVIASSEIAYYGGNFKDIMIQDKYERLKIDKQCTNFMSMANGCTMAFKKNFYLKIKDYHHDNWPHDEFFWQMALISDSLLYMKSPTIFHRVHGNNVSRGKLTAKSAVELCERSIKSMEEVIRFLQDHNANIAQSRIKIDALSNRILEVKKRKDLLTKKRLSVIISLFYDKYKIYWSKRSVFKDILFAFKILK